MMITRVMVALLALYIVSGGGRNGPAVAPETGTMAAGDSLAAQASLARQALDFCLTHRDLCAEAAGGLLKSTGSLPAPPPVPAIPSPQAMVQAPAAGEAAPHLPLPPRRRSAQAGA